MSDSSAPVRQFYAHNTGLFVRLGGGRATGSMHRAVWADSVSTRDEAFAYPYALVADQARHLAGSQAAPLRVLDLGCGVGGGLLHLSQALDAPIEAVGITISPEQVERAQAAARAQGQAESCTFLVGDFHDLPELPRFDLAFAIEAFVQARDPAVFFREAAGCLRPGGRLVLIDDVLRDRDDPSAVADPERTWIETFRAGWHAQSLRSRQEVVRQAEAQGLQLQEDRDLTPYLELGRLRDWLIAWCVVPFAPLLWHWSYARSLIGGHALQQGLRHGVIHYRQLVFEREGECVEDAAH